jgi:hypothetical protein
LPQVIAVTVLHYEGESPETRLLEIIESSGEAEVFDVVDALEEFDEIGQTRTVAEHAVNDNEPDGSAIIQAQRRDPSNRRLRSTKKGC